MTKFYSWLGGVGLAALMGVMLFGVSGIYGATEVEAQSPPDPPATFVGSVMVDGEPAAVGTSIEARVGDASCGTASVFEDAGEARYSIQVSSAHPTLSPDCGSDDATVTFYVGGQQAQETGTWVNHELNILDLTVVSPTATPTDTPDDDSADDGTDDADDDNGAPSDDDDDAVTATPGPPDTGTGAGPNGFSAVWLLAAIGLGAAGFGAAGTVAARRK